MLTIAETALFSPEWDKSKHHTLSAFLYVFQVRNWPDTWMYTMVCLNNNWGLVTRKTQGWSPAPEKATRDTHLSSLIHVSKGFQRIKNLMRKTGANSSFFVVAAAKSIESLLHILTYCLAGKIFRIAIPYWDHQPAGDCWKCTPCLPV